MRTSRILFAFVSLTGLFACAPSTGAPEDELVGTASAAVQGTCGGKSWVGVAPGCPQVSGWAVDPIFPGAPAPLDGYCGYRWDGSVAPQDALLNLTASAVADLAEDCPVIVPQAATSTAAPYDETLAHSLRASLQEQVGTVDRVGLRRTPDAAPVRVVVIDSAPDALPAGPIVAGNDRHGDTLAGIIGDITCGADGCAALVGSALALPWVDEATFASAGGHVGRPSDLARALWQAYLTAEAQPERLILNLSLGWEDAPGIADCGDDPAQMTTPVRAVYDVIEHLACGGALVIAAAGNDAGGPHPPSGMMCPARWEAAPLGDRCHELAGAPRVHAVGGLDYAGQPLALTRPGGRPRLAATALGGVGWASTAPVPPPLTGTSVAAAVVSAVSAVVWSERPDLSAHQVIAALHEGGLPSGPADVCPAAPEPCEARRVSLCTALAQVGVGPLPCAPAPDRPTSSPPLAALASVSLSLALATVPPAQAYVATAAPVADPGLLPRWDAPAPALSGGAFPQPIVPVCPSCTYSTNQGTAVLYARTSVPLTQATLVLDTGSSLVAAPLSSGSLAPGSYQVGVTAAPAGVWRAFLTGYDTGGNSALTQEILIAP